MKKFLDLKRSIVDSKNQPTLIQTYLDTIRSSCYKLATPYISPRTSRQQKLPQNQTKICIQNTDKHLDKNTIQIFKQVRCDTVSPFKKNSNNKTKKITFRCNISELMQSTNESDSNQTIIKNIQNSPSLTPKAITSNHIQQIFQTLQSNCKIQSKEGQTFQSQKQIIQAIMVNLNMLNKKKQYQQSIKLIKNIIEGMGEIQNDSLAHHSQIKNVDYIMQTPEPDMGSSRENSHFKSCMQVQDRTYEEYDNKNIAMMMDWTKCNMQQPKLAQKIKILKPYSNESDKQNDTINKPFVIKYSVYKNPYKSSSQGQSIYIEDSQQDQLFESQQYDQNNQQQELNDTMKSQDLNKWKQDQLYQISQHQEDQEDPKSSVNSSVVPEETIEFKKILYMLDSGSTSKKIPDLFQDKHPQLRKVDTNQIHESRNSYSNSNRSAKRLFAVSAQQKQNQTISHQQQVYHCKTQSDQNSPSIHSNTSKYSLESSHRSTHRNSDSTIKLKSNKIKQGRQNQIDKHDKSKDLVNIVDMLNKKYNRTIKLTK